MIERGFVRLRRTARGRVAVWLTAVCLLGSMAPPARADDDGYSDQDYDACIDCHENSGIGGISETKHFDFDDPKTPAAQKQCQSCHGPSAKHMKFPMQVANVHFGKGSTASAEVQNGMCLECHAEGEREGWQMSPHGLEKVRCSTCHSIHQPDEVVPSRAVATETCDGDCHTDIIDAVTNGSFTHPVSLHPTDEDDFTCITCHNPHGPLQASRCLECHEQTAAEFAKQTDKARRFHETALKREIDCMRCHKGLAHPIKPLHDLEKASLEALPELR